RAQDRLHSEWAVRGDRVGDLQGTVECFTVLGDVADQPDLLRFCCVNVPAGQQDVCGDRVGDLAGEAYRGAAHREQSPAGFGHAELGAFARDADVGALQDLRAARDRGTFDGGDEWFRESAALQQP